MGWSPNGSWNELIDFQLLKDLLLCLTQNVLLVDLHQPSHKFGGATKFFDESLVVITQA
jgi:hypothetical protein